MTCTCGKDHDKAKTPCMCPFCGEKLRLHVSGDQYNHRRTWYWYTCSNCENVKTKHYSTALLALAAVNTRTPDARLEKYRTFIETELAGMRKLVAEQEGDSALGPFAQVLKGKVARYRTILES